MIRKEPDPFLPSSAAEATGQQAEANLGFYLKRHYSASPFVHVFNDFRFEHKGEVAQIDHLILHKCGMMVVESKSVTSSIRFNERGEWARLWDGEWKGMHSPLQQGQNQLELLWSLLDTVNTRLLGRMLGIVQRGFGGYKYDVFTAISDSGIVERPSPNSFPDVCKADQVPDRIWDKICLHRKNASSVGLAKNMLNPLNFNKWDKNALFEFSDEEFTAVSDFLLSMHKPRKCAAPAPAPAQDRATPVTSDVLVLPDNRPPKPTLESTAACHDCSASLSPRVMDFCRSNLNRFGNRVYCMNCQKKY
jgi:hypothetical protein